jgi:hypothetical protein
VHPFDACGAKTPLATAARQFARRRGHSAGATLRVLVVMTASLFSR